MLRFLAGLVCFLCSPSFSTVCDKVSKAQARTIYDKVEVKAALSTPEALTFGVELTLPNITTAETLGALASLQMIFIDATKLERLQVSQLVNATERFPTLLVGGFESATDPELKPKLDAGLTGASLKNPHSRAEVETFLDRLFFPPLGHRPLGPSKSNQFLAMVATQREKANDVIVGAIRIGDELGAERAVEMASARGLNLIILDYWSLREDISSRGGNAGRAGRLAVAVARIEHAARSRGIPLATQATTHEEVDILKHRGYRHFIVGNDVAAILKDRKRFFDIDRDDSKEHSTILAGRLAPEKFVQAVKSDKIVFLGFLMTPEPTYANQVSNDQHGLWIDAEHGPFSLKSIERIFKELPPQTSAVVRASHSTHPDIPAYLKAGAQGIVAPSVETAEQAAEFVRLVKTRYPNALAIVMIETKRGVQNVNAICAIPGIDVLHVGPYDLATSLEAERGSVLHAAAIAEIEAAARAAGIPLGGAAASRSAAYQMYDKGYRFLTSTSDQEAQVRYFGSTIGSIQGGN